MPEILEKITHKEEIESLLQEGERIYNKSVNDFESQKNKTTNRFAVLGNLKLKSWAEDISHFLRSFGCFKEIQMIRPKSKDMFQCDISPSLMLQNMSNATENALEVLKVGTLSLGAGALVGVAAYGGAILFAHTSTGIALSTLSGVVKASSTLSWFGGGSIAAGGLGVKGGIIALGSAVVIPALLVATTIAIFKGKEKLAEAQKIHDQNVNNAKKIDILTEKLNSIEIITNDYISFIQKVSSKFNGLLNGLDKIIEKYGNKDGIKFSSLSEVEQKTLHLSWAFAQVYYQILTTSILNENGNITEESNINILKSQKSYEAFSNEILLLENEKKLINKRVILIKKLSEKKLKSIDLRIKNAELYSKKALKIKNISKIRLLESIELLEKFDNIDLSKSITNLSGEAFNQIYSNIINLEKNNFSNSTDFLFGLNTVLLRSNFQQILIYQNEQYLNQVYEILKDDYSNISLFETKQILDHLKELFADLKVCENRIKRIHKELKRKKKYCKSYDKKLKKYIRIVKKELMVGNETLDFEALSDSESKKIILLLDSFVLSYLIEDMIVIDSNLSLIDNKSSIKLYKKIYKNIK